MRLSAAVASRAGELIRPPSFLLNRHIHSFSPTEHSSTTATGRVNSTGTGLRIFSAEVLASSKPIIRIMAATARPDRYSNRACP